MRSPSARCPTAGPPPALMAVLVLVTCAAAAQAQGESTVYYQVTYANGTIRDLGAVPETHKGIERVVRISRIHGPDPGLTILSTGSDGASYVKTGRTIRAELRWNGLAWVGRAADRRRPPPPASQPAAPAGADRRKQRQDLIRRLEARLEAQRQQQQTCRQAVVQAAELLTKAKGTGGEKPAMLLLEKAQSARQQSLEEVVRLEGLLSELTGPPPGGDETGKVVPAKPARLGPGEVGVVEPIIRRRVPPHRTQVWKLPPGRRPRTCTVAMAHPEAGPLGAFRYVAYTDADGDGVPDTLIARSPLAAARTPGGWTSWSFDTAAENVFVGNAWSRADAVHYHGAGDAALANCRGLGTEVFVAGWPTAPFHKCRRPYLTNIRVRLAEQVRD